MNKSARKAVNLSVLQRHDPHITDIIDSSSYVVVYNFDEASQAWTKKGVEGTMFVFKRSTLPSYGFFIMNRLGIDNLMADLTADMALQLTSDYIIYRDEKDIHGIWVYEPTDRDRIGEKLLECCKRATDDPHTSIKPSSSASSGFSEHQHQSQPQKSTSQSPESTTMDPLSQMLNAAMSRARVSESSGIPTSAQSNHPDHHPSSNASTPARPAIRTLHEIEQELAAGSSSSLARSSIPVDSAILASAQAPEASKETNKNEIPSFLMAIISKDGINGSQSGSPSSSRAFKDESSSLLNSLSGNSRPNGGPMSQGPPLSAELLPASVMPSGLYGSVPRSTGGDARTRTPSSTVATATLLNRPNVPHQSPLQAPAFAYSPSMMHSPLAPEGRAMNGMMMGPPHNGHPMPPPPPPFQHPGMHPLGMPMMPPPPMPGGPGFPADAMHAAMGAVGFMQQRQAFHGATELTKADFSRQFMELLQNDPEFMDVLYANYKNVFARR